MSKPCIFSFSLIIFVFILAEPAFSAIGTGAMSEIFNEIVNNTQAWKINMSVYARVILSVITLIAFAIGLKDLALSGGGLQLEGILALVVRFVFIVGIINWLLLYPDRLLLIPESLTALGVQIGGSDPSIANAEQAFNRIINPLGMYYAKLSWVTDLGESILCLILLLLVWALMILFATTVLLVQIETVFILIGGMITASFFVLGYFREMFMGYIRALAMNGMKLLLLSLMLGLMLNIMNGWGQILMAGINVSISELDALRATANYHSMGPSERAALRAAVISPAGLYDTAVPIVFGLLAFYIILKSVPQYAVAILSGHATADGSLGRAAVMAGLGTVATVWNVSRGISQTARNTANAVHNASNAFGNTIQTIPASDKGPMNVKDAGLAMGAGALAFTSSILGVNGGYRGGGSRSNNSGGSSNEMRPGDPVFNQAYNAKECEKLYLGRM
jgi:hypothetical protein